MAVSIDELLRKAKSLANNGNTEQAENLYCSVLERCPENKRAIDGLKTLQHPKQATAEALTQDQYNHLIALYNQRDFQGALAHGKALAEQYPRSIDILNFLGVVNLFIEGR